jgi:multidrug efflux pump subunit AcrA (membrane-fusion protein)
MNKPLSRSNWSRRGSMLGSTVLLTTLLASVAWGAMAPISGAVVAHGTFVVEGERQKVQYRDGGRIAKVHVALGEQVSEGQVLVSFDVPELEIRRRQATEMMSSLGKKLTLNISELKDVRKLYDKGLVPKQRYLQLERERVQLEGDIEDTRLKLQELDIFIDNSRLRSPGSGRVVELANSTPGGVVRAGDKIMELLPDGAKLVIDTHLDQYQIDDVKLGSSVEIRLSGLNQKITPTLRGEVIYVSPDSLTDERTAAHYFQVRIEAKAADLARYKVGAGMPADVMIETGERSLFEYALKPISDSLGRSLREPL